MSYRKDQILSLQPESESSYVAGESEAALKELFAEILQNGVHGFCGGQSAYACLA